MKKIYEMLVDITNYLGWDVDITFSSLPNCELFIIIGSNIKIIEYTEGEYDIYFISQNANDPDECELAITNIKDLIKIVLNNYAQISIAQAIDSLEVN